MPLPTRYVDGTETAIEKQACNSSKKPFDILAEGLISKDSRGDKTRLELFLAGVQGWDTGLRRKLKGEKSNS